MGQTWYERQLGSGFPVTSHKSLHNTKERISSHAWHEILRLSPHLFWLGVFTHGAFSSAQDDGTEEWVASQTWMRNWYKYIEI